MSLLRRAIRRLVGPPNPETAYRREVLRRLLGGSEKECPCCGYKGQFRAYGHPPRYDAICGGCGASDRQRLLLLTLAREDLVRSDDRVLHFAPEPVVSDFLRERSADYVSCDIAPGRAMLVRNIEALDEPDQAFDLVVASHVLEHVDDRRALHELFRVLGSGGRLLVMVPIIEGWDETYENPSIAAPNQREQHFGQWDHVRYYGRDFRRRLSDAGFVVFEFCASGAECVRYALNRGEKVFVGVRP